MTHDGERRCCAAPHNRPIERSSKLAGTREKDEHPNKTELLDRIAADITNVLEDRDRSRRAGARMTGVLLAGIIPDVDGAEVPEVVSDEEHARYRLIEPYMALAQMPSVVAQCEFYFRRYPFTGGAVSRSDHLRNVCEMYFDRVIQFRDRLKRVLTICRDEGLIATSEVGRLLKLFDRAFDFEHRSRNQTHHAARFDYTGLSRLGLAEMLGKRLPEDIGKFLSPKSLYQKEAKDWVERVKSRSEALEGVVEHVAGILLTSPKIPPRQKARRAVRKAMADVPQPDTKG